MRYELVDEETRRGYRIWDDNPDTEDWADEIIICESVVTNPDNFLPLEEVEGNARDAFEQFEEQKQMREAAALGLERDLGDAGTE